MIDTQTIIAILFRLINFIGFTGLSIYIFRRYMLASIETQINDQEVYLSGLSEQKLHLQNQQYDVVQSMQEQAEYMAYLAKRIVQWNASVHKQLAQQDHMHHTQKEVIRNRMAQQAVYLQQSRHNAHIVAQALKAAQAQLQIMYADTKANGQYLNNCLSALRERS